MTHTTAQRALPIALLLLASLSLPASAQERRISLFAQTSDLVGGEITLGKVASLRPGIGFVRNTLEDDRTTVSVRYELAAPIFIDRTGPTRVYVGPSFSAQHVSSYTGLSSTLYGVGGFVGIEHQLAPRIAVYAEVGVVRSNVSNQLSLKTTASRTALGMIATLW